MDNNTIITNDKTPIEQLALEELINSNGWAIIVKALKESVLVIEKKLHGEIKLDENETILGLQKQWADRKSFIDLPQNLIDDMTTQEAEPLNLDPFE